MIIATWDCPECQADNSDDYSQTVRPACAECGLDFEWGEVLDPDAIISLNSLLEDMARESWKVELGQRIADLESEWEELDQKIEKAATRHQEATKKRNLGLDAGNMRQSQKEIEKKLAQYRLELSQVS